MIDVKNLSFSYENRQKKSNKTAILKSVNFSLKKYKLCALLGSNGSGKSTLLKCLMNFLRPQTGEIYINNEPSINKTPEQMASLIAYTPQNSGTYFDFSAFEVVLSGRARFMRGLKFSKTDHKIAQMALINVGAYELKNKAITTLSGGERQLVFIARSLAQQTPMMILDEPTSALDFKNQIAFWEILRSVCVSEDDFNASNLDLNLKSDLLNFIGKTAIVCTHDPNHALWFCDEILALKNGEIIAYGDAKSALNEQNLFEIYGRECKITDGKIQFIAPYPILSRFATYC